MGRLVSCFRHDVAIVPSKGDNRTLGIALAHDVAVVFSEIEDWALDGF
jgi:hypothetical protein